jgi:preprotein translocase subunit SecE
MARNPSLPSGVTRGTRRAVNFRFVGEAVTELRRVTWPTRQETTRLTIMVLAVSAIIGAFLAVVDLGFARVFDLLLGNN